MARKSWHLHRRTFLRGTGAAIALPLLDSMSAAADRKADDQLPRRMCCFYFPFGVSQVTPGRLVAFLFLAHPALQALSADAL